jgi:hypothetical protein
MKTKMATKEILDQHYCDLVEKGFFPKMRDYMMSGPVVCMVGLIMSSVLSASLDARLIFRNYLRYSFRYGRAKRL